MKSIKLALFLTCVSLLYPQLFTQGAFSLKCCLLKAVFRIYFRSPLRPVTSFPVAPRCAAFLEKPRLWLHLRAFPKSTEMTESVAAAAAGAQRAPSPMQSPGPILLAGRARRALCHLAVALLLAEAPDVRQMQDRGCPWLVVLVKGESKHPSAGERADMFGDGPRFALHEGVWTKIFKTLGGTRTSEG